MRWLVVGPGPVPEMLQFAWGLAQGEEDVALVQPFGNGQAPSWVPSLIARRLSPFLALRTGSGSAPGRLECIHDIWYSLFDMIEAVLRRANVSAWRTVRRMKRRRIAKVARAQRSSSDAWLFHSTIAEAYIARYGGLPANSVVYFGTAHPRIHAEYVRQEIADYPDFACLTDGQVADRIDAEDALLRSDCYIAAPSQYAIETFRLAGWPAERLVRVRLGIHDVFFERSCDRARLNGGGRRVLYVGRITLGKGIPELVDACQRLQNVTLTLLGQPDGSLAVPPNPRVQLQPRRDRRDLVEIYQAHDVVVLDSYSDGFGYAPLEALACGTPVVLSTKSIGLELQGSPGVRVIHPRQPEQLAQAIDQLLALGADERSRLHTTASAFRWTAARMFTAGSLRHAVH